jgi:hypothetical protein
LAEFPPLRRGARPGCRDFGPNRRSFQLVLARRVGSFDLLTRTEAGMGENKNESDHNTKPAEQQTPQRPPADLHDPFNRFDFEPTDGGDF